MFVTENNQERKYRVDGETSDKVVSLFHGLTGGVPRARVYFTVLFTDYQRYRKTNGSQKLPVEELLRELNDSEAEDA